MSRQRCPRRAHRHTAAQGTAPAHSRNWQNFSAGVFRVESGFSAALPPSGSGGKFAFPSTEASLSPVPHWIYHPSMPLAKRELGGNLDMKLPISKQNPWGQQLDELLSSCQPSFNLGAPMCPAHPAKDHGHQLVTTSVLWCHWLTKAGDK